MLHELKPTNPLKIKHSFYRNCFKYSCLARVSLFLSLSFLHFCCITATYWSVEQNISRGKKKRSLCMIFTQITHHFSLLNTFRHHYYFKTYKKYIRLDSSSLYFCKANEMQLASKQKCISGLFTINNDAVNEGMRPYVQG